MLSPVPLVTVTGELASDGSVEIHFHAGGQGYWVARMIRTLGEPVVLCVPLGGESGDVYRALAARQQLELEVVESAGATAAYVHDRRPGDRVPVFESGFPAAGRHELDELHSRVVTRAARRGVCVLAGHPDPSPPWLELYERTARDLASLDVEVVADLSGDLLDATLRGGVSTLKTSAEELGVQDGGRAEVEGAIKGLVGRGAQSVVVTRESEPAIAYWSGCWYEVEPPRLEVVDGRGGGDATTAALAVGIARDASAVEILRLAGAAGAASIARRGLASAKEEAIRTLLPHVRVEQQDGAALGARARG